MDKILVTNPSLPEYQEYIDEIKSIWETKYITNFGPKYKEFISRIKEMYGYHYVDIQCNGHMMLQNILSCIEPGEVITTSFTFVSTVLAIANSGHKPVFCDIKEKDYNIDEEKIEALITDRTVAIVPVHVFGIPCNVEAIQRIADKYHLKVVYDAAHAFNVKINGINIGEYGDASMFSFHATKVFNSIEGGMGIFRTKALYDEVRSRSNFGLVDGLSMVRGVNSKFNEFQAAMGIVNLRHVVENIEKRKKISEVYDQELENVKSVTILKREKNIEHNYAYYPIVINASEYDVQDFVNYMAECNVFVRRYFYPAINDMNIFKTAELTPIAHNISNRVVCLPMYADLQIGQVTYICKMIKEFFRHG